MYIKVLLSYIFGYVNVIIEGYSIERFMNIAKSKSILLWNNRRDKSTILHTNISIKDFKIACKIAKQTKCRIKIQNKKGVPFIFNKYKKRKLFFVFLLLIIIAVISLSRFIWNIEITGNNNIDSNELLETLKQEGLKVGVLKSKINTKEIINKMRLDRNDLAWIGIELNGTNAVVKIVEADAKPEIIQEDEYCNIVATKDGVITKINAINGTPLVKEGDTIKKGTILIGGFLEGKYTGTRYVHANGEVYAKVWYSEKQKVGQNVVKLSKTGNEEKRYSVKLNNFQINFYKTLSKFQNYDTIVSRNKLKIFSDFYLPIEIITTTNYEQVEETINYTLDEAKNKAIEEIKEILDKQIEGNEENILNTYINYNEETYEITVTYEMLEAIGTKEKIVF